MINFSEKSVEYKVFIFRYCHNGRPWQFELLATDEADAQARINSISEAQLMGECAGVIPANESDERPRLRLLAE